MRLELAACLVLAVLVLGTQKHEFGLFENFVLTKKIFRAELKFKAGLEQLRSELRDKRNQIGAVEGRQNYHELVCNDSGTYAC